MRYIHYFRTSLIFSLLFLFMVETCFSKESASNKNYPPNWPWRGATVSSLKRNETDIARLAKEFKANSLRITLIPRTWSSYQKIPVEAAWAVGLDWADKVLDACKQYGIVGIISLSQFPVDPSLGFTQDDPQFWDSTQQLQEVIKRSAQLAERFAKRGKELAAYEILSEPLNRADRPLKIPKQWPGLAGEIVKAIRKFDPTRAVIINAGPGGLCTGYETFTPINDPNIIYGAHMYVPHAYTHQGVPDEHGRARPLNISYPGWIDWKYWDKKAIEDYFQPLIEFQRKYNVLVWIGEFSAIRWAPGNEKYLADCLDIFEKYGWGWCYHTYKEWHGWNPDYGSKYTEERDVKEALVPAPSPRWKLLMKYFERSRQSE